MISDASLINSALATKEQYVFN